MFCIIHCSHCASHLSCKTILWWNIWCEVVLVCCAWGQVYGNMKVGSMGEDENKKCWENWRSSELHELGHTERKGIVTWRYDLDSPAQTFRSLSHNITSEYILIMPCSFFFVHFLSYPPSFCHFVPVKECQCSILLPLGCHFPPTVHRPFPPSLSPLYLFQKVSKQHTSFVWSRQMSILLPCGAPAHVSVNHMPCLLPSFTRSFFFLLLPPLIVRH